VAAAKGSLAVVRYLVHQCGANVGARTVGGDTALTLAATFDHLNTVAELADRAPSSWLFEALVAACRCADPEVVHVIATHIQAGPWPLNASIKLAVAHAIRRRSPRNCAIVRILHDLLGHMTGFPISSHLPGTLPNPEMNHGDGEEGDTPLGLAITCHAVNLVNFLIDIGAPVTGSACGSGTIIMAVMRAFRGEDRDAIIGKILKIILARGEDIAFEHLSKRCENTDATILSLAVEHGAKEIVSALILAGGRRLVEACDRLNEYSRPGHLVRLLAGAFIPKGGCVQECKTPIHAVLITLRLVMAGARVEAVTGLEHGAGPPYAASTISHATHGRHRLATFLEHLPTLGLTGCGVAIVINDIAFLEKLLKANRIPIDPRWDTPALFRRLVETDVFEFETFDQNMWFGDRLAPRCSHRFMDHTGWLVNGPLLPGIEQEYAMAPDDQLSAFVRKISYKWTPKSHSLSPHQEIVETVLLTTVQKPKPGAVESISSKLPVECWYFIFSFLIRSLVHESCCPGC
jgi:hypothetical protein